MKNLYFIEVTDTFGGDANYSWVERHILRANTVRGAINRFSKMSRIKWHHAGVNRYDSKSGATCFFIDAYEPEFHSKLRIDTDEREGC